MEIIFCTFPASGSIRHQAVSDDCQRRDFLVESLLPSNVAWHSRSFRRTEEPVFPSRVFDVICMWVGYSTPPLSSHTEFYYMYLKDTPQCGRLLKEAVSSPGSPERSCGMERFGPVSGPSRIAPCRVKFPCSPLGLLPLSVCGVLPWNSLTGDLKDQC